MPTTCITCGHPDVDHLDGSCLHDGPEDRCQETPGGAQCQCGDYSPADPR